jgi:hypothetical protein
MTAMRSQLFRTTLSLLALAASAAAQSLFSQGQVLMAQGDPIPGLAGATNGGASALDFPVSDLSGRMLFRARFVGGGATNNLDDRAYFLGRTAGDLQMLIRSGDPEPSGTLGAGTVLITQSSATLQLGGLGGSPRISPENGFILFGSGLIGPSIITSGTGRNDSALFLGVPGGFQVLAQRGTPTGVNGTLFDTAFAGVSYQTTSLNSSGTAAFQATLIGGDVSGTTNNFATFVGQPGALSMVIRKGDQVPVAGGGTCEVGFVGFNAILNAAGMVLHDERFNTTGGTTPATTANDSVLMVWIGGNNQIVMREGDPAPLPTGTGNFGAPTISQGFGATGGFAFGCTLNGGSVTTADDNAIFVGDLAGIQLVHREGTPAPGIAGALMGTGNFTSSYSDFEGGSVAFYCTLTDAGGGVTAANDQSLWLGRAGNLRLIAREGDAAPGFANVAGFVSATFGPIQAGSAQLNARGQMVFSGVDVNLVTTSGPTTLGCSYAWDPVKGLQLLLAAGDTIATGAGLVAANNTGGLQFPSSDGAPLGLNNQGDAAQRVNFNTGGAIVRTHLGSNNCSPSAISVTNGGVQTMQLDAGIANANQLYLVACSGSGSRPGFQFGGAQIDLNLDAWTSLALNLLNSFPWTNTFGLLDANGRTTASFGLTPGFPSLAGQDLRHALVVLDFNTLNVLFAGEPCGLLLY